MPADDKLRIIDIADALPPSLASLAALARQEGHRHLDRLIADWASGAIRFREPGEALLAAELGSELAGVGGMTTEPRLPGALRMRRFYVRPSSRGRGIGRRLVQALMLRANASVRTFTVNTGDEDAARFWERVGLVRTSGDGFTHLMRTTLAGRS